MEEQKKMTRLERIIETNKDKKQCLFYLERNVYPTLLQRAKDKGLSISAYSRWIIKKHLIEEETTVESEIKLLKKAVAKLYGMIKSTTTN